MSDRIRERIYPLIKCALGKDLHICEEPIVLTCSHSICKSCLPSNTADNKVICKTCKQQNQRDLNQPFKSDVFESLLDMHVSDIFVTVVEDFSKKLEYCKDLVFNLYETFDIKVEFIRDEIQLRIESLKTELEKLNDKFNKDLDKIKSDFNKKHLNTTNSDKRSIENFSKDLENYRNFISKQDNLTSKNVYDCQHKLRKLNDMIKRYEQEFTIIQFNGNNVAINSEFIGEIVSKVNEKERLVNEKIVKNVKENKFELITLESNNKPYSFCVLPNNRLLSCNFNHGELYLYDENLKLINTIKSINGEKYNVMELDTNNHDAIYLCAFASVASTKSIVKIDMNFNKLTVFNEDHNQTTLTLNPNGISYSDGNVYVCDYYKRIIKLTEDLAFDRAYNLNYVPWYIKANETTACIRESPIFSIHFHDIRNFNEIKKYDGHRGVIGASRFYFYEYYHTNKTFYCYNENGELLEEVQININNGDTCSNGSICLFNSNLFICNITFNKIIRIDCSSNPRLSIAN